MKRVLDDQDFFPQVFFGWEVVVDRSHGQFRVLADLAHRRAVVSLGEERG